MLSARDPGLARKALDCTLKLVEQGSFSTMRACRLLAGQIAIDQSPLGRRDSLARVAATLRGPSRDSDPILDLYLTGREPGVRLLAARLLDLDQTPVQADVAAKLLAPAARTLSHLHSEIR